MEAPTLTRLKTIFNRYKLSIRVLNEDDVEIGGGNNIKLLRRYYLYFPLAIGSAIIIFGFLVDFVLFQFCGIPFLLYAIYGYAQINRSIEGNSNTTIIKDNEIRIAMNQMVTTIRSTHIKNVEATSEYLDDELYEGKLSITDSEDRKHVLLTFLDHNQFVLNDHLEFLSQFVQTKMNASGNN